MKFISATASLSIITFVATHAEERLPEVEILHPGVRLSVVAEHPDIATPTGVDVDKDGQVWAVACHTHMPPKDYDGPTMDEILIFEPDGTRRIFYDKTSQTMDLELGEDGWVYLAERDRILRVRDSDGDGKGDVEETLVELVSEAVYPHNALSGLAWDPNGELVFGLGENFAKAWDLNARDGSSIPGIDRGGVFRITAEGGIFAKSPKDCGIHLASPSELTVKSSQRKMTPENIRPARSSTSCRTATTVTVAATEEPLRIPSSVGTENCAELCL
jgi:hypothetical protein